MRIRALGARGKAIVIALTTIALAACVYSVFGLHLGGSTLIDLGYRALLLGLFLPLSFLFFPLNKKAPVDRVPWYDILLCILSFPGPILVFALARTVVASGWEAQPPLVFVVVGMLTWFLIIEAVRRSTGPILATITSIVSIYPFFANYMPSILVGKAYPLDRVMGFHLLSSSGMIGLPMQAFGAIILGFIIFGVVLQACGGGKFFINLALALLGHVRGGPAKVSVAASALFGTMSGSALSNVYTTGVMTIPLMKKSGYPSEFAAAVEACAASGGVLMPPVMGLTAFLMANFLQISYTDVVIAAIIPSALYYLALFLQVDFRAAKSGIKGLKRSELPSLKGTLKQGVLYICGFIVLVYFLLYLRLESQAPFYAAVFLAVFAMVRKETRLNPKKLAQSVMELGTILAEIIPILAAVGLIMGSLTLTGAAHSFSSELTKLAGNSLVLLLAVSALGAFVLGMGVPEVTVYIFLALLVGPALIGFGIHPIAAHLFFLYWGMISFITPPVCLAVFATAGIAQASSFKTGLIAVKLGISGFIIPFVFVINPAMVAQGTFVQILWPLAAAALGILLISAGIEGYMLRLGAMGWIIRVLLLISGLLLVFPSWQTNVAGAGITLIIIAVNGRLKAHRNSLRQVSAL